MIMARVQMAGTAPAGCEVIGLDVAKKTLCLAWGSAPGALVEQIANSKSSINQVLRRLPKTTVLGLESTGSYHRLTCDLALSQGLTVYLLNPRDVKHYGQSIKGRAKTDLVDARVIARYVENERQHLRPYQEAPPQVERIQQLVRRRSLLVTEEVRWKQHLGHERQTKPYRGLAKAHQAVVKAVEEEIDDCFSCEPALEERRRRLLGIPGVGPMLSAGLVAALARGSFTSADAFVAYLGLDLRVQDSGMHKGRRRLTKRGDPEMRRLLFNGAKSVCSGALWRTYYQASLGRGLGTTEALVMIARRLARTAWSMDHHQSEFRKQRVFGKPGLAGPVESEAIAEAGSVVADPEAANIVADAIVADAVVPDSAAVAGDRAASPRAARRSKAKINTATKKEVKSDDSQRNPKPSNGKRPAPLRSRSRGPAASRLSSLA